jgi:hypothetical protein
MLLHSIFFMMIGFNPNAKRIQKPFENGFGKSI